MVELSARANPEADVYGMIEWRELTQSGDGMTGSCFPLRRWERGNTTIVSPLGRLCFQVVTQSRKTAHNCETHLARGFLLQSASNSKRLHGAILMEKTEKRHVHSFHGLQILLVIGIAAAAAFASSSLVILVFREVFPVSTQETNIEELIGYIPVPAITLAFVKKYFIEAKSFRILLLNDNKRSICLQINDKYLLQNSIDLNKSDFYSWKSFYPKSLTKKIIRYLLSSNEPRLTAKALTFEAVCLVPRQTWWGVKNLDKLGLKKLKIRNIPFSEDSCYLHICDFSSEEFEGKAIELPTGLATEGETIVLAIEDVLAGKKMAIVADDLSWPCKDAISRCRK